MRKHNLGGLIIFITSLMLPALATAQTVEMEISAGRYWGDTTYEIGGLNKISGSWTFAHFPVSRLEFPMDFSLAAIAAEVSPIESLVFKALLGKSISDPAGPMQDSDWGIPGFATASPLEKDIYSETDCELSATTAELAARYNLATAGKVTVSAGAGYKYQNLNYECGNGLQIYPSTGLAPDYLQPGAIDYTVIYHIPYLQFGLKAKSDRLRGGLDLGFAPAAFAHDEDDHNLRYLFSKADCTGTACFINARTRYYITPNLFAGLVFEKMIIDTDGEEDAIQYPYGATAAYAATVDKKISSDQSLLKISLGFSF